MSFPFNTFDEYPETLTLIIDSPISSKLLNPDKKSFLPRGKAN